MNNDSNPYRPPAVPSTNTSVDYIEHSTTECPYCSYRVTFFQSLRQTTPFVYRCAHCGRQSKIRRRGPLNWAIYGLAMSLMLAIAVALFAAQGRHFWMALSLVPVLVVAWLVLEILTYRSLKSSAKFLTRPDPLEGKKE